MKKVIIVRYCEIHLKGKNRSYFQNLLIKNIKRSLKNIKYNLNILNARYLIEDFDDSDYKTITQKLEKICGIHSYSPAFWVKSNIEDIKNCCLEIIKAMLEEKCLDRKEPELFV